MVEIDGKKSVLVDAEAVTVIRLPYPCDHSHGVMIRTHEIDTLEQRRPRVEGISGIIKLRSYEGSAFVNGVHNEDADAIIIPLSMNQYGLFQKPVQMAIRIDNGMGVHAVPPPG